MSSLSSFIAEIAWDDLFVAWLRMSPATFLAADVSVFEEKSSDSLFIDNTVFAIFLNFPFVSSNFGEHFYQLNLSGSYRNFLFGFKLVGVFANF